MKRGLINRCFLRPIQNFYHTNLQVRRWYGTSNNSNPPIGQKYDKVFQQSLADPAKFWGEAAKNVHWFDVPEGEDVINKIDSASYQWFPKWSTNTCYNALDLHVEKGNGEQTALIYDSPLASTESSLSYNELLEKTSQLAGALQSLGVNKGDCVLLYMPMVPSAVIAMLACARIGAIHSVVFGGFAANELAKRIELTRPKVVLSASCGIEPTRIIPYKPILEDSLQMVSPEAQPEHCVILQRPQCEAAMGDRDLDWDEFVAKSGRLTDCVPVSAQDPLYVLFTSGTTGNPKGVVRENGGHLVALNWSMKNLYGINPGEVWWAASDIGWVVGHSYIVYAPLIYGATSILYEGKPIGTPDAGAFWRVIAQYGVSGMFTAPTAIRAIKQQDPDGEMVKSYDLSKFRSLFLAGERCDPDTIKWCEKALGVPIVDHWWQTETGWAITANCIGIEELPVKSGSSSLPCPGYDLRIVDDSGKTLSKNESGNLVVKLPLPPGSFNTLWNDHTTFQKTYMERFHGFYETGDAGYIDEDNYVFVMSRTDDVLSVAGHRLSSGSLEEAVADHPDVAEVAVVGAADSLKGQLPFAFIVLNQNVTKSEDEIRQQLIARVRSHVGAVAAFKKMVFVNLLPKTRSGKILRRTLRNILDGEEYTMPPTIEDPTVLDVVTKQLKKNGFI